MNVRELNKAEFAELKKCHMENCKVRKTPEQIAELEATITDEDIRVYYEDFTFDKSDFVCNRHS